MSTQRFSRRAAFSAALPAALGAAGCSGLVDPPARADDHPAPRATDRIPDVEVVDHSGRRLRFYSDLLADRRVVINFMYTRCNGSCPATVALLRRIRPAITRASGKGVLLLSLTLDADHDTPAVLADYARGVSGGAPELCEWKFLTGRPEDLDQLRRALGLWDPDPRVDADRTQHAALLTFGNDRLDRWAALPAGTPEPQIVRTIARILNGAGRAAT